MIFITGEFRRGTNTVEEEIRTHVHTRKQDKQIRSHYPTALTTSQDMNTGLEAYIFEFYVVKSYIGNVSATLV